MNQEATNDFDFRKGSFPVIYSSKKTLGFVTSKDKKKVNRFDQFKKFDDLLEIQETEYMSQHKSPSKKKKKKKKVLRLQYPLEQ